MRKQALWSNRPDHKLTLNKHGEFVGWDGEGVTVQGTHRYILLMNSNEQKIVNTKALTTKQCFEFMLDSVQPGQIHVCFASGYDLNKMFRNIPKDTLEELWLAEGNELVHWDGYSMQYRKAKNFYLRRNSDGKYIKLYDVFSFFQCSFVKALLAYFPDQKDNEELITIKTMKELRSKFQLKDLNEIEFYCSLELKWLVLLMNRMREHLHNQGLNLARWDGAGAVAASLLRKQKIKNFMNQDRASIERALRAYYGGRIETTCIGHTRNKVFQYDLRSAYPAVIRNLPSLKKGVWVQNEPPSLTCRYSLHRVQWNFDQGVSYYPLPFRDKNDSIKFPYRGRGWYWGTEVLAAVEFCKAYGGNIRLLESWSFVSFQDEQDRVPFLFVDAIYNERKELKRKGDGAEGVNKLMLNSIYGKTHQQLGGTEDKLPTYFQPEWSGFITAQTRASLLQAALLAERDTSILMFATDAIFSLERLPLTIGENLGEWDETVWDGIVVVQPGVYYLIKGDDVLVKYRGFDYEGVSDYTRIIEAWKRGESELPVPTTRFVTLGSALVSDELWNQWGEWVTTNRELVIDGFSSKRHAPYDHCLIPEAASDLVYLWAKEADAFEYLDEDSKPFHTLWNPDPELEESLIEGVPAEVFIHETSREENLG